MNGRCIVMVGIFLCSALFSLRAERIMVRSGSTRTNTQEERASVPLTVTFKIDREKAVIGEALDCELRAIFDPQRISIRGVSLPAFGDTFFLDQFQGPERGSIELDGKMMTELRWKGMIYPRASGSFVIPPARIEYGTIESQRGGFFAWAFGDNRLYQINSNDQRITVEPCPVHQNIDAVGEYHDLRATIDRASVNEGEAVSLTIAVRGRGNAGFEETVVPTLPTGCTWYRDGIARNTEGAVYTFVIQVNDASIIQIPAQKCIFYNPRKKEVYSLKSDPITISVKKLSSDLQPKVVQDDLLVNDVEDDVVVSHPEKSGRSISLIRQKEIPQSLFLFLIAIMSAFGFVWVWRVKCYSFLGRVIYFLKKRYGMFVVRRLIKRGMLTAAAFHEFVIHFDSYDRDDEKWSIFWLEIERYYFGGAAEVVLPLELQREASIWIGERKQR